MYCHSAPVMLIVTGTAKHIAATDMCRLFAICLANMSEGCKVTGELELVIRGKAPEIVECKEANTVTLTQFYRDCKSVGRGYSLLHNPYIVWPNQWNKKARCSTPLSGVG